MLLQADKALSLLDKESPAGGLRRSIRQTDTICLCGAGRPVRHDPVASPQDGTPTKQVSDKTRPQNRCGSLWARIRRQDNETPALNALKALRGAPISMGRGEIPVELLAGSHPFFASFYLKFHAAAC